MKWRRKASGSCSVEGESIWCSMPPDETRVRERPTYSPPLPQQCDGGCTRSIALRESLFARCLRESRHCSRSNICPPSLSLPISLILFFALSPPPPPPLDDLHPLHTFGCTRSIFYKGHREIDTTRKCPIHINCLVNVAFLTSPYKDVPYSGYCVNSVFLSLSNNSVYF